MKAICVTSATPVAVTYPGFPNTLNELFPQVLSVWVNADEELSRTLAYNEMERLQLLYAGQGIVFSVVEFVVNTPQNF